MTTPVIPTILIAEVTLALTEDLAELITVAKPPITGSSLWGRITLYGAGDTLNRSTLDSKIDQI